MWVGVMLAGVVVVGVALARMCDLSVDWTVVAGVVERCDTVDRFWVHLSPFALLSNPRAGVAAFGSVAGP